MSAATQEVPKFETFEEFWPFYVSEHADKLNRRLHFVGTTGAIAALGVGLLTGRRWLLAAVPLCGYGFAWVGHFFVEKNRPASFKYPLWSLRADLVMYQKILAGEMDAEVEKAIAIMADRAEVTTTSNGVTHDNGVKYDASVAN